MKNEMKNGINRGNKNMFFQGINQYKNNITFDYDEEAINLFREKFPKKVKKMEKQAIKELPYLKNKCFKKFLDKKVNKLILPPIIERPEGNFYLHKDEKTGKRKTAGGYNLPIYLFEDKLENESENDSNNKEGGMILMDLFIESLLEELTPEQDTLIKMYYGISPYERKYSYREIYDLLDMNERISLKIHNCCLKEAKAIIKNTIKLSIKKLKNEAIKLL